MLLGRNSNPIIKKKDNSTHLFFKVYLKFIIVDPSASNLRKKLNGGII